MTKFVQKCAITAVMACAMFTQSAQAQKLAMVDVNTVVSTMPDYLAANQKMQAQTKAYQDSLQIMKTKYQTTQDTYAKLGTAASDDMKKKESDELSSLQDAYTKFYDEKFNQQTGELATMNQNLMKPILEKVQNALDAFRKKEHLSFIFPKGSVVSTDPELDLTTKFGDFLKAQ